MKVKRPVFMLLFFIPLIAAGAAPAAAAPNSTNATDSGPAPKQGQAPPQPDPKQPATSDLGPIKSEFPDGTVIYKPNWTESGVIITFESKIPTYISITDWNAVTEGKFYKPHSFPVTPGEPKTVQLDLVKDGGMSITVSNGQGFVQLESPGGELLPSPTKGHVAISGLTGGSTALILLVGRYRQKKKKDNRRVNKLI